MIFDKPLRSKAYGSIGHLPGSRLGPGDHSVPEGQAKICVKKVRDKHDYIVVQEKLDGSCTAVAKIDDQIVALGRSGYLAQSSKYEQHQLFAFWVREREDYFQKTLKNGERLVGEWLAQAHGTRYDLKDIPPWVPFDLMVGHDRLIHTDFLRRLGDCPPFETPTTSSGGIPGTPEEHLGWFQELNRFNAIGLVEGVVYRVERKGKVDFLAKYVRPDKVDGCFLPEISNQEAVWNWRPSTSFAVNMLIQLKNEG